MLRRALRLALSQLLLLGGTVALAAADLNVVGTGDGIDLLRAVSAAYAARQPGATIDVPPSIGSGGGIAAVASGKEIMARIARPLSESEKAAGLVATPIMRLPSAFYVHPDTGVTNLTAAQLADIFAGKIVNWREVGGPDKRIRVVRREDNDSTLIALRQLMPGWRELSITERSKTATTTQEAVESVRDVDGTIGFGPYSTSLEGPVKVLKVDGRFPTDNGYPSAVTLMLVTKRGASTALADDFLGFARSEEARAILRRMGGVPVGDGE